MRAVRFDKYGGVDVLEVREVEDPAAEPGRVVVAVSNPTKRTLVDDEAIAYHEGVPGHHLQISIAQTLEGLPKFRLHGFLSAYGEGWALYSEVLGKEIGFYQDPVSDYGRLNSEMLRAVRLVVDTGIHDKNWSRQQVIDYMHANDINDALAQTEADRYIAWPGQALAYKMGQLTILKLRDEAKTQLGEKFDLKAFHDEILNGGAMPLDLLQERVEAWIKDQKLNGATGRATWPVGRVHDLGGVFNGRASGSKRDTIKEQASNTVSSSRSGDLTQIITPS